jgi:hypothetical protein
MKKVRVKIDSSVYPGPQYCTWILTNLVFKATLVGALSRTPQIKNREEQGYVGLSQPTPLTHAKSLEQTQFLLKKEPVLLLPAPCVQALSAVGRELVMAIEGFPYAKMERERGKAGLVLWHLSACWRWQMESVWTAHLLPSSGGTLF